MASVVMRLMRFIYASSGAACASLPPQRRGAVQVGATAVLHRI